MNKNIRITIVLSTGHVSEKTAYLLDGTQVLHWEKRLGITGGRYSEYGWFMFASPVKDDRTPADLFAVMQYARAQGAEHVLFDRDEPADPNLPKFDW